jgi:hypothetical protein
MTQSGGLALLERLPKEPSEIPGVIDPGYNL